MTIKGKMTIWYTLLMVVLAILILFFMLQITSAAADSNAETILKSVVEKNRSGILYENGHLRAYDFKTYDDGAYLQVYDRNGTLLAGLDPWKLRVADELKDGVFTILAEDEGPLYFYSRQIRTESAAASEDDAPEVSGTSQEPDYIWLCAVLPAENMTVVSRSVIRMAFIVLPLVMLLAIAGSWVIAHRSLAPVRKITESAHEISTGDDLSRRIELKPGKDEIHKLADTFNAMFSRLERSFIAERQFTSDASHELRTPTAVILAECGMSKKLPDDPAELRQSLDVVERQARKMSSLISRLLTFTRLDQGTQKLKIESFDFSEQTAAVCGEQRALGGVAVTEDIDPGVMVCGDKELLMILLQNLLSNARKYGRENGNIWVTLRRENDRVRLEVRDDGIGMMPEELPRIWDRFYQADPARSGKDDSLGLGLSMVKDIARLHGGEVEAESEAGKGSRFIFTLPLTQQ